MDETPAPLPALPPLARLRAELCALDPIRLPPYAGSAWRGLLGPQHFTPRELVFNLLGRLRLLAEHHGGQPEAWA